MEQKAQKEVASDLHDLIDKGILYEDQFIELYLGVLRDEGFMDFFEPHADEARQLMTTMITESGRHKTTLEELKRTISAYGLTR